MHYKVALTKQRDILTNNSAKDPIPQDFPQVWQLMRENNIAYLDDPKYSVADIRYRLKHFFKYMFVRHPLERILSAYKQKLVIEMAHGNGNYYKKLLPKILKLVRPGVIQQPLESIRLPFADILRFLKAGGDDIHFTGPYANWCQPCMVKYDYIGKVETFEHDMNAIIERQLPAKRGKGTKKNSSTGTLFYKKLVEYKHVPVDLITFVKNKYSKDIAQFGYRFQYVSGSYFATCAGSCC